MWLSMSVPNVNFLWKSAFVHSFGGVCFGESLSVKQFLKARKKKTLVGGGASWIVCFQCFASERLSVSLPSSRDMV